MPDKGPLAAKLALLGERIDGLDRPWQAWTWQAVQIDLCRAVDDAMSRAGLTDG